MFIVLSLVISLTLSAGIISANGTGKTLEEAKLAAQLELSSQLTTKVSSKQRLMTSEHISGSRTISEELLYQDITIFVDNELLGIKYKNDLAERNSITITAYIDESSLSQYLQKLSSLKRNIDEIEQRNLGELSLETRKSNLAVLLRYYEQFETYSTIARALNNEAVIPQLLKTKAGAELDYLAALNLEGKLLQSDLDELKSDSTISIGNTAAQLEAKIKMQEIVQKLEENQRIMLSWDLEQNEHQQKLLQLSNASIQKSVQIMSEKADRMKDSITESPQGNDPVQLIRQMEENKQTFLKVQTDFEAEYRKQSSPVQALYLEKIQKLEASPYRVAEMVGGIPTENAKSLRNQEILELQAKMKEELGKIRTSLQQSIQSQQQEISEVVYSGYRNLESKRFMVKSLQDEISLKVGSYDGYRKSWPLAVRFSIFDIEFAYDTYISYEDMTGISLPKFNPNTQAERDVYNNYLDQVDLFEAYFSNTKLPLVINITYQISPTKNPSEYMVIPTGGELFRSDTGMNIGSFSKTFSIETADPYTYSPVTNVLPAVNSLYEKIQDKNLKKNERKELLENPSQNYREGLFVSLGFALLFPKPPYDTIATGPSYSVSWYCTPFNNVYCGLAGEISFVGRSLPTGRKYYLTEEYIFTNNSIGIYPLVGVVFPIASSSNFILKPFIDLRFGVSNSLISVLNLGLQFTNLKKAIDMDVSLKLQLGGENNGLWSITFGFNTFEIPNWFK